MRVTVDVQDLGTLRDVAGTTNAAIGARVGLTKGNVAVKMLRGGPWFPDELPGLQRAFREAPRPVRLTLAQIRRLIGPGGLREKRWMRGKD